jgi:quinoprotein glucose dehydrogenase
VTAGGLIFSAGTVEPLLRAFDPENGQKLWSGPLPGPARATPMTYQIGNRQFVVICSGGHPILGGRSEESVVAFVLPQDATRSSQRPRRR